MSSIPPDAGPSPQIDPSASPMREPPRQPIGKTVWVVLGMLLAMLIVAGVICGGGYLLATRWQQNSTAQDIRQYLAGDPTIRAEIGAVDRMRMSPDGSTVRGDDRTLVYDVQGDQGSGKLTVYSMIHEDGDEQFHAAVLLTDDGRELPLEP